MTLPSVFPTVEQREHMSPHIILTPLLNAFRRLPQYLRCQLCLGFYMAVFELDSLATVRGGQVAP